MYPDSFDYHRAESVDEALDLLADHEEAEVLAGGHSLLPTMKSGLASPGQLVDIGDIAELSGVTIDDDAVTIGALTTYADFLDTDGIEACEPFAEAVGVVGDIQVRNRGTVGGNLAHADPGADLPGAALAADATIHVAGPDGERTVGIDDFFVAMFTTDVAETELITAVELPTLGDHDAGAYVKKESPSSGYAMIGVGVRVETDGETIENARVAANGALNVPSRLEPVEDVLAGGSLDDDTLAEEAGSHATDDVDDWELMDDVQASAEFRAHLLSVYVERAIDNALERVEA